MKNHSLTPYLQVSDLKLIQMKEKIQQIIENLFEPEADLAEELYCRARDYKEHWETEEDFEYDIIDEVIEKIAEELEEPNYDWYYNNKYGDIKQMVYNQYPLLKTL